MQRQIVRGVLQRLESLERAGVTHVKKVAKGRRPLPVTGGRGEGVTAEDAAADSGGEEDRPRSIAAVAGGPRGGPGGRRARSGRLHPVRRTCLNADADRLRRRQSSRPARLLRRGAGGRRRSGRRAVRGPGGPTADRHHRQGDEDAARGRLHSEHPPLPSAGKPQSAARGSRQLPRVSRSSTGDHPAGVHLLSRGRGRAESAGHGYRDRQAPRPNSRLQRHQGRLHVSSRPMSCETRRPSNSSGKTFRC